MLSGAEEGAQGAPFESYKLAAVRLAEAVRLASRGNDSENDLVLELSGAGAEGSAGGRSTARGCLRVFLYLIYQPISVVGMAGRCRGRELLLPGMGESAPQLGRVREHSVAGGQREPPSGRLAGRPVYTGGLRQVR